MRIKPLLLGVGAYVVASIAGIILLVISLLVVSGGDSVDGVIDTGTSTPFTFLSNLTELFAFGFAGWVSSWISETYKLRYAAGTGIVLILFNALISGFTPFCDPWWMWVLLMPAVMVGAYLDWRSLNRVND